MTNVDLEKRLRRVLVQEFDPGHLLTNATGYFVGLSSSNPYVETAFDNTSFCIRKYGQQDIVVAYSTISALHLPAPRENPPTVCTWAEGFFMVHEAELDVMGTRVTVFGGVRNNGKSEVYAWHKILCCIQRWA